MENTKSSEQRVLVGTGSTQLLCETYIKVKPPMSKILTESWVAEITDYTVFNGSVLVKGTVEHTFHYLHPHGKKSQSDEQKEGEKSRESDDADTERIDEFKILNGWGELADFSSGIIHFHQQSFAFKGTVTIDDVLSSDNISGVATVTDSDVFDATDIEDTGLISGGSQTFKIDISLTATRGS